MTAKKNIAWAGLSQVGRILFQTLTLVVLSRLLPASDFGTFAMAGTITSLAFILRDMGTAAAVIQRKELSESLLSTVFWFNVAVGLVLALTIVATAPVVAHLFKEPKVQALLMWLAITFPVASSGATHQALLERRQQFKALALVEVLATLLGLVAAVVAALSGLGALSLVVSQIVLISTNTLGLWLFSRWVPAVRWSTADFKSLIGYSGNLFGSQFLNYFSRNSDTMLIGRFLGTQELGWYNLAYKLMLFPLYNLSLVVARATFPQLSQIQSQPEMVAKAYLRSIGAIAMLTFPLMAGLYVLREPFVLVVLGNKWLPVADVLQWLAPVGLIQSLTTTMGMIYMVTGRTVVMFRWGFISSVLTISAMAVGIPYGFLGVAKCYAAINALIFWPTCYFALSQINLGLWAFLKGLFPTFCAAVGMGLAVALLVHVMGPGTLPVYVLASGVLFGMLAYALLSALLVPDFRQMSVALLKRVRGAK